MSSIYRRKYGANIYYNSGNVGIGTTTTATANVKLQVGAGGALRIANSVSDYTMIGTDDIDSQYNTRILFNGNARAPNYGRIEYQSPNGDHIFYTTYNTIERMRITSTGNVGIGTATPSTILDIYKSSYTGALLSLDAGGEGDTSGTLNPRGIGKPLIKLGKKAWSNFGGGTGDYYGIGFGYSPLLTDYQCVEIGTLITSTTGLEMGDFVVSTRPNTAGNVIATERMRITSTGNVGIGTNNPNSILHLYGSLNRVNSFYIQSGQSGIMLDSTLGGVAGTRAWNIWSAASADTVGAGSLAFFDQTTGYYRMFIKSDGGVVIGGNLNVGSLTNPSDSRIKKDIEDINDESALNKLLLIQPTTYNYIDVERNKGFGKVYGFIAQQIREVIPEAVSIVDNIIPNIYRKCICEDNKRIYIVLPQEVLNANIKILDYGYYTITKIESDYIEVEDYSKINKDIPDGEQFVYGYNIKDFHTLNKDYIFTLNVCATQELHRRIEAQNVLLKSQDVRINDLEKKVAMLMSSM